MILLPIAFVSGVLTVFSPCVLPVLPIILASGIDGSEKRIRGVISGLVVSFTIASLLLATIVRTLNVPADTIRLFAVGLLVFLGVTLVFPIIGLKFQTFIERFWHFQPSQNKEPTFLGGFLTGVSLGVVWTPCIGPIIATVATLAAVSSFSIYSVLIAFSYALGTGLPLYFFAKGGSAISQKLNFVKTENQKIRQVFGIIVLATALFIWSGADRAIQAWTLINLPDTWTQIGSVFEKQFNVDSQLNNLKGK